MTIAKDGSLTTKGVINALSGVNTNTIRSLNRNVDVVLGNNVDNSPSQASFTVQNAQEETVASINDKGTAQFKKLSLSKYTPSASTVIAAADNLVRNGQYIAAIETTSETAGAAILPSRSREVIIYNDSITESSLVYLTATSSVEGGGLTVIEKITCNQVETVCRPYFKVSSPDITATAVTFNWLIIN